ncbi:MAG: hypothetical protein ABIF17_03390 [Patescibacteria group bacterium]
MSDKIIEITKKQFFIIYGLFFCLFIVFLFGILSGCCGIFVLLGLWCCHFLGLSIFLKIKLGQENFFLSFLSLFAYYILSLSFIYYIYGITNWSLIFWLVLTSLLMFFLIYKRQMIWCLKDYKSSQEYNCIKNFCLFNILILVLGGYLISNFFSNPVLNGSPTPWINVHWSSFIIFFIICICVLFKILKQKEKDNNFFIAFIFLFIVLCVVSIKYVLSFGYDSLIHQASLKYIVANGQIDPLTPFYIGQYMIEVLINKISGIPFIVLERWLVPLSFLLVLLMAGNYLIKSLKINKSAILVVSIVTLIFLPTFFTYTAPFSFALIFVFIVGMSLFLYLQTEYKKHYYISLVSSIVACVIHPFVGLSILIAVFCAYKYKKNKINYLGQIVLLFFYCVLIVPLFFVFYNWITGHTIFLKNPFVYANDFLILFGNPVWYSLTNYSVWLHLVYVFEKAHLLILFLLSVCWLFVDKKNWKNNIYILVVVLGTLVSAWLFVSAIEVQGYSYGDNVNYAFRLIRIAKWFIWTFVFLIIYKWLNWLCFKNRLVKVFAVFISALFLTICFYITYPRNDDISRINVNNIRAVDYQAIDYIYYREGGKQDYIVLANQLFGAAAIQSHGFKPYYQTKWGEIFYYSIPMGGELNQSYEKLMNMQEFDENIIKEILYETGVNRVYFLVTDYWPLKDNVYLQIKKSVKNYIDINNKQIEIFIFE